jgi:hypothetical protein
VNISQSYDLALGICFENFFARAESWDGCPRYRSLGTISLYLLVRATHTHDTEAGAMYYARIP